MKTKLSILILHRPVPSRIENLGRLIRMLEAQISLYAKGEVEIIIDDHPTDKIGVKRNRLLQKAAGEYLCYIDDDDACSDTYISQVISGLRTKPDCCSLWGIITTDGENPKSFKHSIQYKGWYEEGGVYYRGINHLNAVKSSIAKQMKFPETNYGEDKSYSIQLEESGLLKTEYRIDHVIYYYKFVPNK